MDTYSSFDVVSFEVHPPMTTTTMTTPRREKQRARNWQRAVNLVCSPLDNRTSPLHHVLLLQRPGGGSSRPEVHGGGGTRGCGWRHTSSTRQDGRKTNACFQHGTRYNLVYSVFFVALPVVLGVTSMGVNHPWQRVKGRVSLPNR